MEIKKLLGLTLLSATISLNAGMVASITGPNVQEKEYKGNERGIIIDQDVDGDGIIDSKDDCLETIPCKGEGCIKEEPKEVIEEPAVIGDADNDGVLDNVDQCPQTPEGFKVNEMGCAEVIDLKVQFNTSKYDIKRDYSEKTRCLCRFYEKIPNI